MSQTSRYERLVSIHTVIRAGLRSPYLQSKRRRIPREDVDAVGWYRAYDATAPDVGQLALVDALKIVVNLVHDEAIGAPGATDEVERSRAGREYVGRGGEWDRFYNCRSEIRPFLLNLTWVQSWGNAVGQTQST